MRYGESTYRAKEHRNIKAAWRSCAGARVGTAGVVWQTTAESDVSGVMIYVSGKFGRLMKIGADL